MPNCCVYGCSLRGGHTFPKDKIKRKEWLRNVRRKNWTPTPTSTVCMAHFDQSDYLTESFQTGMVLTKKRLKPGAVPTVFPWIDKVNPIPNARQVRLKKRTLQATADVNMDEGCDINMNTNPEIDVAEEVIVDDSLNTLNTGIESKTQEVSCQTVTAGPKDSIDNYVNNPKALHFYTGLENYAKFSLVLQTLRPAAYELDYYNSQVLNLSVENHFFLTLIKLRLNKQIFELGLMFEVSESTVSNIFITWITFMALQWGELDIWPSQDLVHYYMPHDFKKKFPDTRVIVDGTEFPICKPKEPNAQQVTFSTYKNRNTLKVLVGVSPGGLISYCSDASGGAASDRQIVERSSFVNMCTAGDNIMADRGFNVQDIFAPKDVRINIPSFLKGRAQLPGVTVVHDRKIASKRVHVERIIGLAKTYKILKHELNTNFVNIGTELFFVCAMLCNFREGIVGRQA